MKKIILLILVIVCGYNTYAQTYNFDTDSTSVSDPYKPSKTKYMVRGYGHSGLNLLTTGDKKESSYVGSTFAPIFLFKHSDKLMFESELEFQLESNELKITLEYADVMYVFNDNLIVRAGKFILPFGTFMERLHPAWINRLPTNPLGFGHGGIAPGSGIGVELRGAFDLGGPKLNYAVYSTNGPRLNDGQDEPDEAGMLMFQNFEDNNTSKAYGGRLGLLPFADSSTEVGFSAYATNDAGAPDSHYENIGAFLYAIDFSLVKQIPGISGIVDIKGQYNSSNIDTTTFVHTHGDTSGQEYSFNNESNSFYAQLSYRPTMSESDFMKKLELVGRFSNFRTPIRSEWEERSEQYAAALNYWLSWRSLIKVAFQKTDVKGGHDGVSRSDGFFLHWAIGF